MIKSILAGIGAAALLAGAAHAVDTVAFYSFGSGAPTGSLITNFSTDSVGAAPTNTAAGASWAGGGSGRVLNSTSGIGAEPAIGSGVYGSGNYLSILGGTSETLDISSPHVTTLIFYVGSLDTYNHFDFHTAGGDVMYTGSQLGVYSGAANGAQTDADTNGVFVFTFDQAVTGVTLTSDQNSLEIASIADVSGVPEPAAWGLMLLGFGGVGAAMRLGRSRKAVPAA